MEFRVVFKPHDYEAVTQFYSEILGLTVTTSWNRGPGERGAVFQAGTGFIEVLESPDSEPEAPVGVSLYWEVADVDAVHERLLRLGLRLPDLVDRPWGHRALVGLRDPSGVPVSMFTRFS